MFLIINKTNRNQVKMIFISNFINIQQRLGEFCLNPNWFHLITKEKLWVCQCQPSGRQVENICTTCQYLCYFIILIFTSILFAIHC